MIQESSNKNIYQLSGVDDHERGFTRQVEISSHQGQFHAVLRYEKLKVSGEPCVEEDAALRELIQRLQGQGYTQLRTQLIFRGTHYLGSQVMWVDYPDEESSSELRRKVFDRIMRWFSFSRRKRGE
jgi:hypothetical protein